MRKILIDINQKALIARGKVLAMNIGDSTVAGVPPLTLPDADAKPIIELIQTGLCEQNGTPTSSNPVDIKCNNGVLKASKNLFNKYNSTYDKAINASGVETAATYTSYKFAHTDYIPVVGGQTYTMSATSVFDPRAYHRAHAYTAQKQWIEQVNDCVIPRNSRGIQFTWTFTVPANAAYLRINYVYYADNEIADELNQLELGSVATNYMPYGQIYTDDTPEVLTVESQSASLENLFAVGDYKDTQDVITGLINRRCGVCYYDGTQTIGDTYISTTGGKDIGAIIVYPLLVQTTERVTAQPLETVTGTNILSLTANISDIQVSVTYETV